MKTASLTRIILTVCVLLIFCGAFATTSHAVAFPVTNTGDNGGVNPAPNAGTGTLRQAIVDANANAGADTINFAGVVTGTILLESALPNLADDVTISGPGANVLAVKRDPAAATNFRIFAVDSGKTIAISGLTITNGVAGGQNAPDSAGGGIYNGGALTVSNCTFSGNTASQIGGGIYNGGALTVSNCTFSSNSASVFGGGIYIQSASLVTVSNCTFSSNSASVFGGGIFKRGGGAGLTVSNSTFSSNSADTGGGAIFNDSPGAISSATVSNSTFSGNSASNHGGGISNESGGGLTVSNSTFSGNSATVNGGGIYNGGGLTIRSTILNTGAPQNIYKVGGVVTSGGYNLSSDDASALLNQTTDQNSTDPMLDPNGLQDNGGPTLTIALLDGSPAIDQGKNLTAATTDQRGTGFPRTIDNAAVANASGGDGTDIGAVESNFLVVNKTADTDDGVCDDTDCTLREAINTANSSGGAAIIQFDIPTTDPGYDQPNDRYTITLGSHLAPVDSNITINGLGANRLTVKRDPGAATHFGIFAIDSGKTVTISGLTMSGGLVTGGTLFGGIGNNGTLTLSNCTVSGNSGSEAGAIFNSGTGTLTVGNCTISGNTGAGSAISNIGTLTIMNSTISGNFPRATGAINNLGTLTVSNSTITGNSASAAPSPAPTGGIHAGGAETLNNTIVAGNFLEDGTPSDIGIGSVDTANYNLIGDTATSGGIVNGTNGNIVGNSGSGTIDIHTVLDTNLAFNGGPTQTHALVCGGPAIDNGKSLLGLTTDQRGDGFARTFNDPDVANASGGDGTDIGAFEVQTACNRPPTAVDNGYSTDEDTPLSVPAPGVLGNDSDPDAGDSMTAVLVSSPSNGTVTLSTDGSFSYTPNSNYNGPDSFTYKAVDSHNAQSNTATVNITINAVNDPPTFNSVATLSRKQGAGATNSTIATVSDVDNSAGSLVVTVMSAPTGISVSNIQNTSGTITANVAAACNATQGSNTVVLQVSDGAKTATGNLTVNVTPSDPATITLKPSPTLSPANHKYHTLKVSDLVASATDDCGGSVINGVFIVSASSDEPEDANGNGDGATKKDIVIANGCGSVQLRAERADAGNGRVYRVNLRYVDSSNNVTNKTATVLVPTSGPAVDNGPGAGYTVTGPCGP